MQASYDAAVACGAIEDDPAQRDVLPVFQTITDGLNVRSKRRLSGLLNRQEPNVKGLFLWGGVGRGKSMLMDMFVSTVSVPSRRVHFHAFMQEIHNGMHEVRKSGVDDALKPVAAGIAKDIRLLAFDEMHITDITDAMIVGRLFQALFAAGVTVVATSNRHPDDLYTDGLNRDLFLPFIALIKEKMQVHHLLAAADYRLEKLASAEVYFTPADAKARAAIDSLWHDLTDGQNEELVLTVKGRSVRLSPYHNGVARTGFADVCGVPLGPADYLAIADNVRVLILEDIPRLSRSNFNEARRFVTLIDALYEARVRLICSAADRPDSLYVEGEGSFEFGRTASRLTEMQSDDWALVDGGSE